MIGVVIGYIYQECITGKNGSIFSPEMEDPWLFKNSEHTFLSTGHQNIFLTKTGCKRVL